MEEENTNVLIAEDLEPKSSLLKRVRMEKCTCRNATTKIVGLEV
jgi:hypothetical protein